MDLLQRQRIVIITALGGIVLLAWLHLIREATEMEVMMVGMDRKMVMPAKGPVGLLLLLTMWSIMMAGMMLPSAAPVILTFAGINRSRRARGQMYVPTALFVAGYLLTWAGFQRRRHARPMGASSGRP